MIPRKKAIQLKAVFGFEGKPNPKTVHSRIPDRGEGSLERGEVRLARPTPDGLIRLRAVPNRGEAFEMVWESGVF